MKNIKFLWLCLCLFAYNFLFWEEDLGLNLFLFNMLLIALQWFQMPRTPKTNLLVGAAVLSSVAVVLVNTTLSRLVNLLIMSILWGYSLLPTVNSAISAGLVYAQNILLSIRYFAAPVNQFIEENTDHQTILKKSYKVVRISLLPLILAGIFVVIFKSANPIFGEKVTGIENFFGQIFHFTPNFSLERAFFLLFGYLILSAIFYAKPLFIPEQLLTSHKTHLDPEQHPNASNEHYWRAFVTFCLLNLLLLVVNAIDLQYLWFNFSDTSPQALSALVHAGTNWLIFSILLSLVVLLFFFGGSLNFHPKQRNLLVLAGIWLGQNVLLLLSVFIRNYRYIELYGLTHKRIGVYIFLLMTLIGILTMAWKVCKKLNIRFLIMANSWAWMVLFLVASFIDFDTLIAHNNLRRPDHDLSYVKTDLSVRTYPVVRQYYPDFEITQFDRYKYYERSRKDYTWLSWNLPDYRLQAYLKSQQP